MSEMVWLHAICCECPHCKGIRAARKEINSIDNQGNALRENLEDIQEN